MDETPQEMEEEIVVTPHPQPSKPPGSNTTKDARAAKGTRTTYTRKEKSGGILKGSQRKPQKRARKVQFQGQNAKSTAATAVRRTVKRKAPTTTRKTKTGGKRQRLAKQGADNALDADKEGETSIDELAHFETGCENRVTLDRKSRIEKIREAFYEMSPELVVDLFSDHRRETVREVVNVGTKFWLEREFKERMLRTYWPGFSDEQLHQLEKLAAYMCSETTSKAIIIELASSHWFLSAFSRCQDVANDMYNMYFRRDVQVRADREQQQKLVEEEQALLGKAREQLRLRAHRSQEAHDSGVEDADELGESSDESSAYEPILM